MVEEKKPEDERVQVALVEEEAEELEEAEEDITVEEEEEEEEQGSNPVPPKESAVTMGEPLPPADLPTQKSPGGKSPKDDDGWMDYQAHPPIVTDEYEEEEEEEDDGDDEVDNVIVFDSRPSSFLTRKEGVERVGEDGSGGMMVVLAPQKYTANTMVSESPLMFFQTAAVPNDCSPSWFFSCFILIAPVPFHI